MEPTFRLAGELDLGPLLEFMRLLYARTAWRSTRRPQRAALAGRSGDRSLGLVWMIDEGSEPIGYMILTLGYSLVYRGRDAFVDEPFIRADRRRRGDRAEGDGDHGAGVRDLEVGRSISRSERRNTAAQGLYRKSGFVDHDQYLMTKHFGKP